MRKIDASSKSPSRMRLRARAEARSVPNGFSTMTRAPLAQPDLAELFHDHPEQHGRDGEVVRRALGRPSSLRDGLERGRIVVVAVHVAQQARQLGEGRRVEAAVLLDAVLRPRLELVQGPARLGHADHRRLQVAAADHRLQRREDLLVRQVARGAEEDQGVGVGVAHRGSSVARYWPPFLEVPAELETHRREQLVGEIGLAARAEALVQGRREH